MTMYCYICCWWFPDLRFHNLTLCQGPNRHWLCQQVAAYLLDRMGLWACFPEPLVFVDVAAVARQLATLMDVDSRLPVFEEYLADQIAYQGRTGPQLGSGSPHLKCNMRQVLPGHPPADAC